MALAGRVLGFNVQEVRIHVAAVQDGENGDHHAQHHTGQQVGEQNTKNGHHKRGELFHAEPVHADE